MSLRFQTTTFSRLVRAISRGTKLRYPDEIDPSLWKVAIGRHTLDDQLKHTQGTSPNGSASIDSDVVEGVPDKELSASEMDGEAWKKEKSESDRSVVIVDWYGPDDPEVSGQNKTFDSIQSILNSRVYGTVC